MKTSSYGKYIHSQIRKEVKAEMKAEMKAEVKAEMEAKMAEKDKVTTECMLSRGYSLDDIQAITDLPMSVIEQIQKDLSKASHLDHSSLT